MKIETYESDGSDGYTAGTWGFVLHDGEFSTKDGGHASRENAREAAKLREAKLRPCYDCGSEFHATDSYYCREANREDVDDGRDYLP